MQVIEELWADQNRALRIVKDKEGLFYIQRFNKNQCGIYIGTARSSYVKGYISINRTRQNKIYQYYKKHSINNQNIEL